MRCDNCREIAEDGTAPACETDAGCPIPAIDDTARRAIDTHYRITHYEALGGLAWASICGKIDEDLADLIEVIEDFVTEHRRADGVH